MNYNIKIKSMKLLITFGLFAVLLLVGCDQESGITTPLGNTSKQTLVPALPEDIIIHEQYSYPKEDDGIYPPGADSIFFLSKLFPQGLSDMIKSEVIDGFNGGTIEIDNKFIIGDATISIGAKLDIPFGAFTGIKEISMVLNNKIGTISFYPHIVFNEPAEFDLKYTGIDVSDINPDSIDFIFQNYNGSTEQINYRKIKVNSLRKEIHLEKAELNHFSRYGFVNRQF